MAINHITTHKEDDLKRLLYQYQSSVRLQQLVTALFGKQIQDLEDALWSVFGRLDIDNSEGAQLDRIGDIVGQKRLGLSDDYYRLMLKAKIAQNTSEGDIEKILSIWKMFNWSANSIQLFEHFPAEVTIYSDAVIDIPFNLATEDGNSLITEAGDTIVITNRADILLYILLFMQKSISAGVSFSYFAVFDPVNAFGFNDALNAGGFGDATNPDVGGVLGYIEISA